MIPLVLSASKASWQAPTEHGSKLLDEVLHATITKKYNGICQYCGWVDFLGNQVSHLDENHLNNDEKNLVLACPLCHQCLHLGKVGLADGGRMIWAPEVSQIELNHLARMHWVSEQDRSSDNTMASAARSLTSKLDHQAHVLEVHYVSGASDPGFWAEALMKMDEENYKNRASLLKHIKLWPNPTRFQKHFGNWSKSVFVNFHLKDWEKLILKGSEGNQTENNVSDKS
jgi:intracellular multiplication protein IcmJ